jgi:hypothetical protein
VRRLLTPRWLAAHALALLAVAGCLAMGWWQLRRAAGGNALSIGYSVEWPLFAAFAAFMWWREVRAALRGPDQPDPATPPPIRAAPPRRRPAAADPPEPPDDELAAYNRYLAWLAANPERRPFDHPG